MDHLHHAAAYHSERINRGSSTTNNDQDRDAVNLFNRIKETYGQKIEELNELKRQVFLLNHNGGGPG